MPRIGTYALAALSLIGGALAPLKGQTAADPSRIVTTGSAQRSLRPDRAIVRLGVTTHAPTAGEASSQLTERLTALQDTLSHFPVPLDSVQNVAFNVGPNYDYQEGRKLIDYQASAILQFSIRALDRLGGLVDVALAAGATDVPGMTFESDSSEAVRRVLLAEALAEAKADAAALATAGGARLGALTQVSTVPPVGVYPGAAAFSNAFVGELSIVPGAVGAAGPRDVVVTVAVYTTWQLTPRRR